MVHGLLEIDFVLPIVPVIVHIGSKAVLRRKIIRDGMVPVSQHVQLELVVFGRYAQTFF